MSRLIVFGCSYTYGTGLPDCKNWFFDTFHNLKPSQLGWPKLLSKKLNCELINESFPGSSNTEILYTLLKFKFQDNDKVVMMWTHYARDMLFDNLHKFPFFRIRLGPWGKTHQERKWAEYLNEKDYAMKSWFNMHHADLYLCNKNVQYIHYPATPKEFDKNKLDFIKVNNYYNDGITVLDKATDNMHPGIQSNINTADKIYKIFKEYNVRP
jgi:hypothetical protein